MRPFCYKSTSKGTESHCQGTQESLVYVKEILMNRNCWGTCRGIMRPQLDIGKEGRARVRPCLWAVNWQPCIVLAGLGCAFHLSGRTEDLERQVLPGRADSIWAWPGHMGPVPALNQRSGKIKVKAKWPVRIHFSIVGTSQIWGCCFWVESDLTWTFTYNV